MSALRCAAIGLDHRHIYGMCAGMIAAGAELAGYWTKGAPATLAGFRKRFPEAPRVAERARLLEDPSIALVLIAAVPAERAALSIEAMRHGKDVMLDKPGCLSLDELEDVRRAARETGRIWSVNFSERFEVPAATCADALIARGAIGEVLHLTSLAPHRLNAATRPSWFWEPALGGGIIGDIGTHQVDQFMHFAKATDARIVHASVGNFAHPDRPDFQDFGELVLRAGRCQGFARLDWFTPDALPNWGDGRLTIMGSEGYIELRKYVDPAGRAGTDHVILVNRTTCQHIDARPYGTPYFARLAADIRDRTETAGTQAHGFAVMQLTIEAQAMAERRGALEARP